jgi:hypothetical protein
MGARHGNPILSNNLYLNTHGFYGLVDLPLRKSNDYKIVVRAPGKTGKVHASDVTNTFQNGAAAIIR